MMKRILLFVTVLFAIVAFVGCHKDSVEFEKVGVLNLGLQRDYKSMNKGAVESFDASVTIYYSYDDTIGYNCRFADYDGDGRYTNDPSGLDRIYVRRDVGFWVGVRTVIQGDTLIGMSDETNLLYLSDENPVIDVNIVLEAGFPRVVMRTNTEVVGHVIFIYGEVIEGRDKIEEFAFAIRPGQLGDEEKRIWAKRYLSESDMQELFSYADYEFYDAEIIDNESNIFGCALEIMDFDTVEYSVAAIALLRTNDGDSVQRAIHSPVVSMKFPVNGINPSNDPTFVWVREGAEPATGLDEFGLSWEMNAKAINAVIKPVEDASLFILSSSDYSIDNLGELSSRLTQETEATEYRGVDLEYSSNTYDDVIATIYNEKTFLIHVTNSIVETTTSTTYAITGTYKVWDNETGGQPSYSQPTGNKDGYGYVDLGLPSGILWAYTNIGASTPEDYGNYYAWGETETKDTYSWTTYQYCNGSETTLTKYCSDESYGNEGFTDTLTVLEADDDAATANWGTNWRMPTQAEMQELIDNCDTTWVAMNGINGMLFTSRSNGNSIFLSAAGGLYGSAEENVGSNGNYWTSSLFTDYPSTAWWHLFDSGNSRTSNDLRCYGMSVRPVCESQKKSVSPSKRTK